MRKRFFFLFVLIAMYSNATQAQFAKGLPITEKSIVLPGRVKLCYVEQGLASGTPVILLHGFPDSWRSYEFVLPYLPPSVHVYVLSQRGHGNSDRPVTGYTPEDFAGDVAAFMNQLHIPEAIIVGHSMGSAVAQCFAVRYPAKTKALVLIGTFARMHTKPELVEYGQFVSTLRDPIDRSIAYDFQKSTLNKAISEEFFNILVNESMKIPARIWKEVFDGLLKTDFTAELKNMKKPTLLIWGDKDVFFPRQDQDFILSVIPSSRLEVYKGTGHSVQWEEPKKFAEDLLTFIRELAP
jgi:non-heme chloroperoxidase